MSSRRVRAGRADALAAWLLALGSALVFVILATPRLSAQGAYYDELHQAPAAFTYATGVLPPLFSAQTLFGLPALNLSYVGALKSAFVGIYLAATGQPFDLATWRLFGIAFVAAGLAACVRLAYPTLRFWGTLTHHWVMATPFQYAGLAAAVAGIVPDARSSHPLPPLRGRLLVAGAVLALLGVQLVDLASVERGLRSGRAGVSFDPSLNLLGAFVARRAPDARFIATDWGVGTQLLAFASGAPGVVEEVFWEDEGEVRITAIANAAGERDIYFVAMRPPLNGAVSRDVVQRVQESIERFPCFDDLPLEPELTDLAAARVRRVRVRPGCLDELRSTGGGRTSDQ